MSVKNTIRAINEHTPSIKEERTVNGTFYKDTNGEKPLFHYVYSTNLHLTWKSILSTLFLFFTLFLHHHHKR